MLVCILLLMGLCLMEIILGNLDVVFPLEQHLFSCSWLGGGCFSEEEGGGNWVLTTVKVKGGETS